jgi:PAS domain S-box-containing protein
MNSLVKLLHEKEAWLMERILKYARKHGYAAYTSTLVEAWRISIAGLTEAVASAFQPSDLPEIELPVHSDWSKDPVARFGLMEARLHRARGIELGMFLGLFVYYRQAYIDCVREFLSPGEERSRIEHVLVRLFDRMGVAFCSEWAAVDDGEHRSEMAATLREMANEKNRYLTFFESLDHPVVFTTCEGVIVNLNLAAARLVKEHARHGQDYYSLRARMGDDSLCGKNVSDVFPWLAEIQQKWQAGLGESFEEMVLVPGPDRERTLRASVNFLPDVSGKFTGVSILLRDETERVRSTERILRAKEELERTFDTISDIVFLVNGAGMIQRANMALAIRLGLTPKEVVGRTCRDVLGCAECQSFQSDCTSSEASFRFHNLPGSFMVRSNSLLNSSGVAIGKVVVARDVSASEKIQETLLAVESKYRSIFENAPQGIFQSNADGRYLSVNQTMARMFGFESPVEMISFYTDIAQQMYVRPDDRLALFQDGLENGMIKSTELQLRRRDGTEFWGILNGRLVFDDEGGVQYFEGFVQDVSELRRFEDELAQSESRFRGLVETMNQGLVQLDGSGNVLYCNKYFCDLLKISKLEIVGQSLENMVHPEDREKYIQIFVCCKDSVSKGRFDIRWSSSGTQVFSIVTPVVLSTTLDGSCVFWMLVMDVTERKLLEGQLLQTQKLEAIGQLAAGIAHEINTPTQYVLNNTWFVKEGLEQLHKAVDMYEDFFLKLEKEYGLSHDVGVLRDSGADLQVAYYLQEMPVAISETLQGLERITDIVSSVKQFAHPGHERQQDVDLNKLVETTVNLSRSEWKYVAELSMDLDLNLPVVPCQMQEISQVLLNLIINAAHAITDAARDDSDAKGFIRVGTKFDGEWAEIRIEDSGTGIPPHVQTHIFEPFFTTKPVGMGTGQGLFFAQRSIVKNHEGHISFETQAGSGTTFIIKLPLSGRTGDKKDS